jgi:ATP-dependent Clp protease adaptor protein ClpS
MPQETIQPEIAPSEIEEEITTPLVIPGPEDWEMVDRSSQLDQPFIVILYNCECHTFDEVILQMQKATGCSIERAKQVADEVHNSGRAIAFSGTLDACERVAVILRQIRLQVETDRSM